MDTQEARSVDMPEVSESVLEQTEEKVIPYGYCQCGCGRKTKIAHKTIKGLKWIKGEPTRFINGHNKSRWKGGRTTSGHGYILINRHGHIKANGSGQVLEHILVAEKVLGTSLPQGCVVHHLDGDGTNNRNDNLVICQDNNYHKLLHVRTRALKACGNPNWRKCRICKTYDNPEIMYKEKTSYRHYKCHWKRK